WIDALLLILATIGAALSPPRLRSWTTAGVLLLALSVAVSCAAASNKRLAVNAGFDLLAIVLAGCMVARTACARRLAPLIVAAVIAAGGVNAVKCVLQRAYEFDDTLEVWLDRKSQLAAAGVDVSTTTIQDYERRLRSAEAFGHLTHPNVTAACMTASLGLAVAWLLTRLYARPRTPEDWLVAMLGAALCVVLGVGIALTGSAAAMISSAGAIGLLAVYIAGRRLIRAHWRACVGALAGVYVLLIACGAAMGVLRGTLPSDSLRFRWQYWTATAKVIASSPWTGVGRENFAAAYVRYKPAEATEEIRNPHNLWLALLAELGIGGLAGGVLLCAAALINVGAALGSRACGESPRGRRPYWDAALLATVALAAQAWFSGTPFGSPGIGLLWSVEVGLVFAAALAIVLSRADEPAGANARDLIAAGCLVAMLAALVHNLVGFSLLTPAGLSTFVLTVCAGFALHSPHDVAQQRTSSVIRSRLPAAMFAGLALTHLGLAAIPATRAQQRLAVALERLAAADSPPAIAAAVEAARAAVAADRWDAGTPLAIGRSILTRALQPGIAPDAQLALLDQAESFVAVARRRDPAATGALRTAARIAWMRSIAMRQLGRSRDALEAVRTADVRWTELTERYPTQPRDRIFAARVAAELWRLTHDDAVRRRAGEHLDAALRIDESRPPDATARLSTPERQEIAELRRLVNRENVGAP
ncbi:MAG: O-antigen ligase domain-containing protein, partial [Planctomycetota bacterium]